MDQQEVPLIFFCILPGWRVVEATVEPHISPPYIETEMRHASDVR